jgi:hypothetical protein
VTVGQDLAEAGIDAAQAGIAGLAQAVPDRLGGPDPAELGAAGGLVAEDAATGFGDAAAELDDVITSDCSSAGPPHPFPLPDLTSQAAAGS